MGKLTVLQLQDRQHLWIFRAHSPVLYRALFLISFLHQTAFKALFGRWSGKCIYASASEQDSAGVDQHVSFHQIVLPAAKVDRGRQRLSRFPRTIMP